MNRFWSFRSLKIETVQPKWQRLQGKLVYKTCTNRKLTKDLINLYTTGYTSQSFTSFQTRFGPAKKLYQGQMPTEFTSNNTEPKIHGES